MTAFDRLQRTHWAGQAETYERCFVPLSAHPVAAMLDAARVRAGTRVLDVGTGPGTAASLACARGARVVAVDAEFTMLGLARRRVPQAAMCHAVLPDLPFPDDHFDAVVANFVINHVGDPAASVAELRRIVRPGGRIAATVWPSPRPPLQRLWEQVFDAAGARRPADEPAVPPERDFTHTVEGFGELLRSASLTDVHCETVAWVHRTDPEDWWCGTASGIGRLGRLMAAQPPGVVQQIRQHYDRLTAVHLTDGGLLALPTAALLASGRVP
jgi:SAM-dependent methyltransferase